MLERQAQSLQQEADQLRVEARKAGQHANLQQQFQEVRAVSALYNSARRCPYPRARKFCIYCASVWASRRVSRHKGCSTQCARMAGDRMCSCSMQVTELLYQKHTQLERMAAEKAAMQLTMEREIANAREYAERSHRCRLYPLQNDAACEGVCQQHLCWHSKSKYSHSILKSIWPAQQYPLRSLGVSYTQCYQSPHLDSPQTF